MTKAILFTTGVVLTINSALFEQSATLALGAALIAAPLIWLNGLQRHKQVVIPEGSQIEIMMPPDMREIYPPIGDAARDPYH